MRSRVCLWVAMVMAVGLLTGCKSKQSKQGGLFGATGKPLEMVAVIPDGYDTPAFRDSLKQAFKYPMPILPQYEPMVSVMTTNESGFSQMFKSLRNVLYITIDGEQYTQPSIGLSRDQFASGQLLIHARAESLESFYHLLREKGEYLAKLVHQEELARLSQTFDTTYSSKVARLMEEQIGGWRIKVSNDLEYTNVEPNFVWASDQGAKGRTDFVAYTYPYEGEESLSRDCIIAARDSVLQSHVLGQYEGSYMTTEKRVVPVWRQIEFNGIRRTELRGLWAMEGDMMGGPFVLHAIADEANGRVVVAEMIVYYPGGKKKNLMLYAESQLYTLAPIGE